VPRLLVFSLLGFSGCGFFFPPYSEPVDDSDGGGSFFDGGTSADAGPLTGFDKATCTFDGKRLYGQVKYVTSFPDVRVKVVTGLPRLRVEHVSSLPNRCGEWEEVTSLPDLKVQLVDSFPDLTIEYVTSFPGIP
jgi:hypothetical protein